jgi:hypothetical protein
MSDLAAPARPTIMDVAHRFIALVDDVRLDPGCASALEGLAFGDPGDVVLTRLATSFGLSPFECDLIALVGLPDEHEAFAQLARRLHPLGEPWLSFATLAGALVLDSGGRRHLHRSLGAGPLARHHLVVPTSNAPLPERGWRLADGLWDVVRGGGRWPDDIRPSCAAIDVPGDFPEARLLRELVGGGPRIVLVPTSSSRPTEEVAAHVSASLGEAGVEVATFETNALTPDREPLLTVHLAARAAIAVIAGTPDRPPLPDLDSAVVVCASEATPVPLDDRPTVVLQLRPRDLGQDVEMWQRVVPELNGEAGRLAGLLRVDALRATRAVADARASARATGSPVDAATIVGHVRRRSDGQLPPSVRRVVASSRRSRLVTTPGNDALLSSIVDRVRGQVRVLHEWGFADVGGRRGVRALFAGPPGTGKTLSAEITATELGLDLLVVDLSALVSKWLGETEKNISEVFAAAGHCQAVLFFDEADAIFGRRTDASDAQARWANLETAHLLSRIDSYEGLVVMASNLRVNIDEAFVRRLDVIVEFDEPGPDERRRLWLTHLPDGAPIAGDVDVAQLATLYPITGGLIRNAAVGAAFQAAARGDLIDQRLLVDAIRREYQKAGRSFPGIPPELSSEPTRGG